MALSRGAWALLLLSVILGFAALYLPLPDGPARLVPAILFPLLPLLALRWVAGPQGLAALFPRVSMRHLWLAVGITLLNIAVTFAVGAVVSKWFGASANPAFAALSHDSSAERMLFLAATVPQLLGEELLTILPLLALLRWFSTRWGLSRRHSLIGAWLVSALPFALVHLPTYQWNLLQCLLIIGSARLVLTVAYLRSKNLAVSTLAHVLNDWLLFGTAIALSGMALLEQ